MHPHYAFILMILVGIVAKLVYDFYGVYKIVRRIRWQRAYIAAKEAPVKKMSSKTFREFAELSLKNYRQRKEREERLRSNVKPISE